MAKKKISDFGKNERIKRIVVSLCFFAIFLSLPLFVFFSNVAFFKACVKFQKKSIFQQIKDGGVALCQIASDVSKECIKGEKGTEDERLLDLPTRFGMQYDLEDFAIVGYETLHGKTKDDSNLGFVIVGDANIGNFVPDYQIFLSTEDIIKEKLQDKIAIMRRLEKRRLDEIQQQGDTSFETKQELNAIYDEIDSMLQAYQQEAFLYDRKQNQGNTTYYFYQPVIFRLASEEHFVRAVVIAGICDEFLLRDLEVAKKMLLFLCLLIELCSIGVAYILAKLVCAKVNVLVGLLVYRLDMAFEDIDARTVQTALRPSITQAKTNTFEFFSYNKSASNISGDYFDYRKLDGNRYVVIKADVAGHGTAAGVITAIVATLFKRYFDTWCFEENGIVIQEFVRQVNIFLVELNIQGKFTALMIGVYDTTTGELLVCNAGDNVLHIFDSQTRKMKTVTLTNSPAAGLIDNDQVEQIVGYKADRIQLLHGDVVFFFSDGIEENFRFVRTGTYSIALDKKQRPMKESLGHERVIDILESAMNKTTFILDKKGKKTEPVTLDFSLGEGTARDAIVGLAAAEKMLRIYRSPNGTPSRNFDETILQYLEKICPSFYEYFEQDKKLKKHICEDKQQDDFTLLALMRV